MLQMTRSIVVGVELLAAGVQQATVVVFQNREELAEFPGVPDAKTVKGLNNDRIHLPRLDGPQEPLESRAFIGAVAAFVIFQPVVDGDTGSYDVFALAKRVLFIGATSQIRHGRHDVCSLGVSSTLAPGVRRSQREIGRFRGKGVYTLWKRRPRPPRSGNRGEARQEGVTASAPGRAVSARRFP